jgi:hypothetical protein
MRCEAIFPALTAILSVSLAACEPDEVTDAGFEVVTIGPNDPGVTGELLAEPVLEVGHGDHTLTFLESDDGVAVVEFAPADAPSLLDALAREGATALEILRAVSHDVDAPAALLRAHEASGGLSQESGTPVRDLTASITSLADVETGYYPTDCRFVMDGPSYFDVAWQLYGWDWHWYRYATPDGNYLEVSATTPPRKKVRAHTCNNGSQWYNWGVQRLSSADCSGGTVFWRGVAPGHRAVYYQTGASRKCQYYTYAVNSLENVPHGLGIMTP